MLLLHARSQKWLRIALAAFFGCGPVRRACELSHRGMGQLFIVIVGPRAFGVFRSFKYADACASTWGGYVMPLEHEDAPRPWDAHGYEPAAQKARTPTTGTAKSRTRA